mmetsp:Transcript_4482/g.6611  ORF Transcript_4482/g.6611 Transcript_4482/m.6611 type:complete len:121 (-) Transcript_4482:2165-2527(-)
MELSKNPPSVTSCQLFCIHLCRCTQITAGIKPIKIISRCNILSMALFDRWMLMWFTCLLAIADKGVRGKMVSSANTGLGRSADARNIRSGVMGPFVGEMGCTSKTRFRCELSECEVSMER